MCGHFAAAAAELSSHHGVGSACKKSSSLLAPRGVVPTPLPPTRHIHGVLKGDSSHGFFPKVLKAGRVVSKVMAASQSPCEDCSSVTSTSSYYHIPVFLQDYIRIIIKVKNGYGI